MGCLIHTAITIFSLTNVVAKSAYQIKISPSFSPNFSCPNIHKAVQDVLQVNLEVEEKWDFKLYVSIQIIKCICPKLFVLHHIYTLKIILEQASNTTLVPSHCTYHFAHFSLLPGIISLRVKTTSQSSSWPICGYSHGPGMSLSPHTQ